MRADFAAKLSAILCGGTTQKIGVAGVTPVADIATTCDKPLKLQRLCPLRLKRDNVQKVVTRDVAEHVAVQVEPDPIELDGGKGNVGDKPLTHFSDLYETEADYARALIRYARQDGLGLTVKDGRLVIAIGSESEADLLGELRAHEGAVTACLKPP